MISRNYNVFTGKDLMKSCNLTEKVFTNKLNKLNRVYKLDFSKYKENPDETNSNYIFNSLEFEILKVLFNTIDTFPFHTTEKKFDDDNLRKIAMENDGKNFIDYIYHISNSIDDLEIPSLQAHIYASNTYSDTLEWLSAQNKSNTTLNDFFNYTNSLDLKTSAKLHRKLARAIDELLFEEQLNGNSIKNYSSSKNTWINTVDIRKTTVKNNGANQQKEDKNPPHFSSNNELIDFYLIEMLNKLSPKSRNPISVKKEFDELYNKDSSKNLALLISLEDKKKEILKSHFIINSFFNNVLDSYHLNKIKIIETIKEYQNKRYILQNLDSSLNSFLTTKNPLGNNKDFMFLYNNFYKALAVFSNLLMINRNKFIKTNSNNCEFENLLFDLQHIQSILDKYSTNENLSKFSKIDKNQLSQALSQFNKIKNNQSNNNMIKNNLNNITGNPIGEILNKKLNNL